MLRVSSKPNGRESAVTGLGSPVTVLGSSVTGLGSSVTGLGSAVHRSWLIGHRLTGHGQQDEHPLTNDKRLRRAQPFEVLNVGGDYSFQGNSFQFSSEPSTNSSLLLESWMPSPWTLDAVSIMECSENISREVN